MMMLFIPVVALLSSAGNAMRNLASHETALEIEGQDKNDSFSFDDLWNAPPSANYQRGGDTCLRQVKSALLMLNRSIYHGQEPDAAVYYWLGDDLCKRNTTSVFHEEKIWWKLAKATMTWLGENIKRARDKLPLLSNGPRYWAQKSFYIYPATERNFQFTTSHEHAWSDMRWLQAQPKAKFGFYFFNLDWDSRALVPEFRVIWEEKDAAKEGPGVDATGLRKEWVQQVFLNIVASPADMDNSSKKASFECMTKAKDCSILQNHQYYLESLPSGYVVPIIPMDLPVGGFGEKLPQNLADNFRVLGPWLLRAYVISTLAPSPVNLHPLIYESIVKNTVVTPEEVEHYREEDIIPECEYLAALFDSRKPSRLGTYGWLSCDEVKDPDSGNYTQDSCYTPLYRHEAHWEYLYTEWGSVAPNGTKSDDLVPYCRAREYTELKCKQRWQSGYVELIDVLLKSFRLYCAAHCESEFLPRMTGPDLKRLVEGSQEVDIPELLHEAEYIYSPSNPRTKWTAEHKEALKKVFETIQGDARNAEKQISERPLNQLLHFFTGSYGPPPSGWHISPAKFKILDLDVDVCAHLEAHTCFNQLFIPSACFNDTAKFAEVIYDSIKQSGYNMA